MTDYKTYNFIAGDILSYQGKQYQVHENLGMSGLVAEYPAAEPELVVADWNDNYLKTGHQPLMKSTEGGCTGVSSPPMPSDPQQPVPIRILESSPPKNNQ